MDIQKGDTIGVKSGVTIIYGEVSSAINYGNGDEPDWYIELQSKAHGYVYLKQRMDGVQEIWLACAGCEVVSFDDFQQDPRAKTRRMLCPSCYARANAGLNPGDYLPIVSRET